MNKLKCCLSGIAVFFAASVMAQSQIISANIQNEAVSRYMDEVTYTSQEDVSRVADYAVSSASFLDRPQPVVINVPEIYQNYISSGALSVCYSYDDSFDAEVTDTVFVKEDELGATVYDIQPGLTCYYKTYLYTVLMVDDGAITTEGPVRMIHVPSVRNVRDLGGWKTIDGRTVKYGKLFRGGELNGLHIADPDDIEHLLSLGISAEIDLRANYEEEHGVSAFGFKTDGEVGSDEVPAYLYSNDSGQLPAHLRQYVYLQRWRQQFEFILANLRVHRGVYIHCRWGADRSGYLSLLLEGLLGVPYDGLVKDYELSSFAAMDKTKENIDPVIAFIEELEGETLQEKFNTFWTKRVGVNQEDVDYFIEEMLEGEKNDIVTSITDVQKTPITMVYDLLGRRLPGTRHGLVIRRSQDGRVQKLVK